MPKSIDARDMTHQSESLVPAVHSNSTPMEAKTQFGLAPSAWKWDSEELQNIAVIQKQQAGNADN